MYVRLLFVKKALTFEQNHWNYDKHGKANQHKVMKKWVKVYQDKGEEEWHVEEQGKDDDRVVYHI